MSGKVKYDMVPHFMMRKSTVYYDFIQQHIVNINTKMCRVGLKITHMVIEHVLKNGDFEKSS